MNNLKQFNLKKSIKEIKKMPFIEGRPRISEKNTELVIKMADYFFGWAKKIKINKEDIKIQENL